MVRRRLNRGNARAVGLMLGYLADQLFDDPARWHPVAGFGIVAQGLEQAMYRDTRRASAMFTATSVGAVVGAATIVCRPRSAGWTVATTATGTWVALGGASLAKVGMQMATHLENADINSARLLLPSLCGRDPSALDEAGLARATVESIAENTSDAAVAPLLWGAVFGVPGVLGYRAINTLDAMVGYRTAHYANFGWASARLDDVANWLPARVAGLITVALAGARRGEAWSSWRHDAPSHPSPNAGVVEATAAGALGLQLGGPTPYRSGIENRPTLGRGRLPSVSDVPAAVRLSRRVQLAAVVTSVFAAVAIGQFVPRRRF